MAERLADVGNNLALFKVNVDEVKEQDVNARVMPPEMLERLTETVKQEGRLEQLPFTILRENGFEMVSGHHRLRAARAAGLTEIFVLADTRNLPRSKVVAKQVAHNRISGTDDKEILARLFAEIQSVEDLVESYLKPEDFDSIQQLEPSAVTDISLTLEWRQLSLVFLPNAMEKFEKLEEYARRIPKQTDAVGVVSTEIFEKFRNAILKIGRQENIRSVGAIMTRLVEIAEAHVAQEQPAEAPKQKPNGGNATKKRSAKAPRSEAVA